MNDNLFERGGRDDVRQLIDIVEKGKCDSTKTTEGVLWLGLAETSQNSIVLDQNNE